MSINRYQKQRDKNEKEIIEYFEKRGFSVYKLDQPVDLLLGYQKKNYLVEVKMPKKGRLTPNQKDFMEIWNGQFIVIDSIEQAGRFADGVIFGG